MLWTWQFLCTHKEREEKETLTLGHIIFLTYPGRISLTFLFAPQHQRFWGWSLRCRLSQSRWYHTSGIPWCQSWCRQGLWAGPICHRTDDLEKHPENSDITNNCTQSLPHPRLPSLCLREKLAHYNDSKVLCFLSLGVSLSVTLSLLYFTIHRPLRDFQPTGFKLCLNRNRI